MKMQFTLEDFTTSVYTEEDIIEVLEGARRELEAQGVDEAEIKARQQKIRDIMSMSCLDIVKEGLANGSLPKKYQKSVDILENM